MKKRLRKKLHVGEFEDVYLPIAFRMRTMNATVADELLDDFLYEAIEHNGLQFGGYGKGDVWAGFAEPDRRYARISDGQRDAVKRWLAAQPHIVSSFVGEVVLDSVAETMRANEPAWYEAVLEGPHPDRNASET